MATSRGVTSLDGGPDHGLYRGFAEGWATQRVFLTVGALGIVATSGAAVADSVTATIKVGLNPTEVAVNPAGTDAYLTNLQDASVSVTDLSTHTVTATIPVGSWP